MDLYYSPVPYNFNNSDNYTIYKTKKTLITLLLCLAIAHIKVPDVRLTGLSFPPDEEASHNT